MNQTLFFIILFILAQLGIGFWASRFIRDSRDYMVASQSISLGLAMFSLFAAWFGAETLMGTAAAVADNGLSVTRSDPFGYTVCLMLMGVMVAFQLRQRSYITIGDFYRDRFSKRAEFFVTLVMLPTSLLWAATQLLAFGNILSVVTHDTLAHGLPMATLVIIAYTFFGGLLGDMANDILRGSVLIFGLVLLLSFVVMEAGGFSEAVTSIEPSQLQMSMPHETLWQKLDSWLVPILGSLVAQEALSRLLATQSPAIARRACFVGGSIYLVVGVIPVFIALVGTHFDFPRRSHDEFMPDLARSVLPEGVFVIFVGALMSAILSTVQSTLLTFSTLTANNLVFPYWKDAPESKKLLVNRGLVIVAGALGYVVAAHAPSINALADLSSSFGSTGLLVTFFLGLWFARGSSRTAIATLITGVVMSLVTGYFIQVQAPFLISIAACLLVYAVGLVLDRKNPRAPSIAITQ